MYSLAFLNTPVYLSRQQWENRPSEGSSISWAPNQSKASTARVEAFSIFIAKQTPKALTLRVLLLLSSFSG